MGRSPVAVRAITPAELAVLRRAVQVGSIADADVPSLDGAESLHVVGRCACGCASVDIRHLRRGQLPTLVADASGQASTGERVNVLVFASEGQFTGLEVVSFTDEPAPLPIPSTIRV